MSLDSLKLSFNRKSYFGKTIIIWRPNRMDIYKNVYDDALLHGYTRIFK